MEQASLEAKRSELQRLRSEVARLEAELREPAGGTRRWQARDFYAAYYATTGFMLGMFGAVTSLLFNVVGATLLGEPPLKLIQVYLTFGLGERAAGAQFDDRLWLTLGCCLYIGTGMLLGIPFQLILGRFAANAGLGKRLLIASLLGVAIWLINFYGILSWLQPLLFGGNWIVEQTPWYVAMLTHLVFAWTMALVFPLGTYQPYRLQTEQR
ncbi:MAG: hypothetical protein J5I93_09570 [Pirellulaceae bacterium]|nr:hypothetical protein [Pirellulaceae bacterium]